MYTDVSSHTTVEDLVQGHNMRGRYTGDIDTILKFTIEKMLECIKKIT